MAKTALMKKWSEKIMYACYHLLMNLAEDLSVEKKMLKRQLLENMVTHLRNAHSLQLLTVILGFLKKLSGFEENKTALVEDLDTIPVLVRLLSAELAPPKRSSSSSSSSSSARDGRFAEERRRR